MPNSINELILKYQSYPRSTKGDAFGKNAKGTTLLISLFYGLIHTFLERTELIWKISHSVYKEINVYHINMHKSV